jgi:hypothetical protein
MIESKVVSTIPIRHRDEVEAPITDWLKEAYKRLGADGVCGRGRITA